MVTEQNLGLFRSLVAVAYADGQVAPFERRLLEKYREQLGLTPEEVNEALESVPKKGLRIQLPPDLKGRLAFFKQAAEIVHADGVLTEQEAKLLETLRTKMEIPPELTADILHRFDTGTTQRPKPPPLAAAPPRASNRAPVVIGSVVFIGVAALVGWLLLRQAKRGTEKAPFEPFLGDYTKAVDGADEGEEAAASLVGKVVVIDRKEQEVDDLQFDLPEEIRARQPEEVGTVVWLDWSRETQGGYTDGTAAYVQTCTVTVIHREKWEVLGTTVFRGSDPPSFKKGGGSRSGSKPTDEVVRFLAALPRY